MVLLALRSVQLGCSLLVSPAVVVNVLHVDLCGGQGWQGQVARVSDGFLNFVRIAEVTAALRLVVSL